MLKKLRQTCMFFIFLWSIFVVVGTIPVFAHVLQTDGTIGAVMHIDPNDDPIAQSQASFFFEFKDTTGRFDPKKCNCKISIVENDHIIYAQPLFQNTTTPSLDNASLFYTFPNPDVYQVQIHGSPQSANAFQTFTLTYVVRAEQPNPAPGTQPKSGSGFFLHLGFLLLAVFILLVVIGAILRLRKQPLTNKHE